MNGFRQNPCPRFRSWALRIIASFVEIFCAGSPWVLQKVSIPRVTEAIYQNLCVLPRGYRAAIFASFFLLEYSVFPLGRKLRPLRRLPLEQRIRYLTAWKESSWLWRYAVYFSVRCFCLSKLYAEPELLKEIGYSHDDRRSKAHTRPANVG